MSRDGGASPRIAVETTHTRSPAAWCGCVSPTNTIACVLSEQHDTSVAGEPDTAPRRDVGRFVAKRKRLFWQFLFAFLVSANLAPTSSLRTHSCVLVSTETNPVLPPLPFQSTPTASSPATSTARRWCRAPRRRHRLSTRKLSRRALLWGASYGSPSSAAAPLVRVPRRRSRRAGAKRS